jgi:uncharacterized protein YkwD
MDRRSFLTNTSLALGAILSQRALAANHLVKAESWRAASLDDEQSRFLRSELLAMVNRERETHGLETVKLDDFASQIAAAHAQDMASGGFLSHWGRDGRKPYQRYSFAGGTEATQENDGAVDHTGYFLTTEEFVSDVTDSHRSMYLETPPNDGHRKAILAPQHTHVGFGVAMNYGHVRLSEIYVARYVSVDSYSPTRPPRSKFKFSGQMLHPKHTIHTIDVFYEELPTPPTLEWLRVTRPYSLPDARATLFPKLPENTVYKDGSRGSIEFPDRGRFRVEVQLGKLPGIYTFVAWLQRNEFEKPFPATQVCVRVE